MTQADSVHSTPPLNSSANNVIPLFGKKPAGRRPKRAPTPDDVLAPSLSATAGNGKLRDQRRSVWWEADAVMDYWHLSLKMNDAIARVQRHNTPEGELHPACNPADHWTLLTKYRQARARLMLTPAPDMASVMWKRAQLKAGRHKYTDLKPERIERAIADDLAFLAAHPVRQTRRTRSEP
jgi:hypothetical protein